MGFELCNQFLHVDTVEHTGNVAQEDTDFVAVLKRKQPRTHQNQEKVVTADLFAKRKLPVPVCVNFLEYDTSGIRRTRSATLEIIGVRCNPL